MKTTLEQVKEFHESFNVIVRESPSVDLIEVNNLRIRLLEEEVGELKTALDNIETKWSGGSCEPTTESLAAVLDALTDIQYILDGTYLSLGFSHLKDIAFAEVHRSNMSKLDANGKPIHRGDGKVLKGPNFKEPNLKGVLSGYIKE